MPNAILDAIAPLSPIAFFKCPALYEGGNWTPSVDLGGASCAIQYAGGLAYISVIVATAGQLASLAGACQSWDGVLP
jgi:hypothetical protein